MIEEIFGAGALVLAGAFLIGIIFLGILLYVYGALALMAIAKRIKYDKAWLAWIPIANSAMMLQWGGFHWAWIFIILLTPIPFVGWIAGVALSVIILVSLYRVAEKLQVIPAWTVFLSLIPGLGGIWMLVLLGILAWKK